jgi:DMSO/TMAO reductase YedYZ molybdopterin-dependent catalytic subunit
LRCFGLVEQEVSWTWEQFVRLPRVTVRSDIHCVTTWSRFDNLWEGVAIAEILARVKVRLEAMAVMNGSVAVNRECNQPTLPGAFRKMKLR